MTTGIHVRVLLPGDPYTGRVGVVERIIDDENGLIYVVRFREPYQTAYYRRDELTAA
jgi:hypothetical protein